MELVNKSNILKELSLFAGLSPRERSLISERCRIAEYKKGEAIYKEGDSPSAFYCLILGRAMIYTVDPCGEKTVLEYLHRGKYFGIISLLTGDAHSVTAEAMNDSLLLVIDKDDFDYILKRVPALAIDLSQTLSRRLKNKDIHQKTVFESTIISVFSSYSQAGKTVYALNLAFNLSKETHKSVVILDIFLKDRSPSLPRRLGISGEYPIFNLSGASQNKPEEAKDFLLHNKFGIDLICFSYEESDESCVRKLLAILSLLVNDYNYLVLDLPTVMDRSVFELLNQSDIINILTSPEEVDLRRTFNLTQRLKKDLNFQPQKIKVIINEYKSSQLSYDQQVAALEHPIFATLPKIDFAGPEIMILAEPDSEYSKAVRRIARQMGDCLVGLALGVGFAYGFCHVGVLRVIEEEEIPIDAVSGASIGAVIAGLWAIGRSSSEILEITKEISGPKNIWSFVDLTVPFLGFIKGNKLHGFLRKHFGNKTFYDVKCPLKIVASDVRRKESRVIEKGLLSDAIMASCSMPGVFMPFRLKEEMLFDGGVISPLPTEALFKMGVRKIIAVNVTPSKDDMRREYEHIKEEIKEARRGFSLSDFLKRRFKNNILGFIFGSIEMLQSEVAEKEAQLADIVLHPNTQGLHWLELHKAEDFAKRGEEEARKNLNRILQVINE